MPVHDWTRVDAGIFHAFHVAWIPELSRVLNSGLLPSGYYALAEQHAGKTIPDVLTLHGGPRSPEWPPPPPVATGGTAVMEAPPRVRHKQTVQPSVLGRRRTVAIRHVTGHRLVALLEILSPANKDRARSVEDFADKVAAALEADVHVLVVDLFPPGPHDPHGVHGAIRQRLERLDQPYAEEVSRAEPLTLAAYTAGSPVEVYLEHLPVGSPLPEMPLFLQRDRYIYVPLEPTYEAAWSSMPAFWREVLEGRRSPT